MDWAAYVPPDPTARVWEAPSLSPLDRQNQNKTHTQTKAKRKLREVTGLARGHTSHRRLPRTMHTHVFDPNFQGEKILLIF